MLNKYEGQSWDFALFPTKVYKCVECSAEDLVRQDDRHLAPVQPYNPFCRGDQIFCQNLTCLLKTKVLLQTYIEHLRGLVEDKKTINHHGREREIDLETTTEKTIQVKPAVNQAFDLE